jgi:hypothetical protein
MFILFRNEPIGELRARDFVTNSAQFSGAAIDGHVGGRIRRCASAAALVDPVFITFNKGCCKMVSWSSLPSAGTRCLASGRGASPVTFRSYSASRRSRSFGSRAPSCRGVRLPRERSPRGCPPALALEDTFPGPRAASRRLGLASLTQAICASGATSRFF